MKLEIEEEIKKKPIDLNLTAARNAKSAQTGFIHLCYQSDSRDTIPILENFCYALALLRSRLVDNVLEAKLLLEKLLPFEVAGNFPIYLHEYPQCKRRTLGIDLIPIFHWILQGYQSVLSQELVSQLESCLARLIACAKECHAQRPFGPFSLLKLQSYCDPHAVVFPAPKTSEEWGEALIAYQLAASQGVARNDILEHAMNAWHAELLTPLLFHHQAGYEPQPTLFDLFMGHYFKQYSKRAVQPQRIHLLAALIHPFATSIEPAAQSIPYFGTTLPYTLYWGKGETLHSLILDHKKSSAAHERGNYCITLPQQVPPEGEEAIESSFFLNLHPDHTLLINGEKATTFKLGDEIRIVSQDQVFSIRAHVTEGEGRFFGHILRANRPHQKKAHNFEAFDWQIALRTIARSETCTIQWSVNVESS